MEDYPRTSLEFQTRFATDEACRIMGLMRWGEWRGEVRAEEELFSAEEVGEEFGDGVLYQDARWFDARVGQFLDAAPIEHDGETNYRFAKGDAARD